MGYVISDTLGGWQTEKDREQTRFDALASADRQSRERAIAEYNLAAERAADKVDTYNRFVLQQMQAEQNRQDRIKELAARKDEAATRFENDKWFFNKNQELANTEKEVKKAQAILDDERFGTAYAAAFNQANKSAAKAQETMTLDSTSYINAAQKLRDKGYQIDVKGSYKRPSTSPLPPSSGTSNQNSIDSVAETEYENAITKFRNSQKDYADAQKYLQDLRNRVSQLNFLAHLADPNVAGSGYLESLVTGKKYFYVPPVVAPPVVAPRL